MSKKILFISTANLATNPRTLKEIKLAGSLGYQISFLGFHLGNWSDQMEDEIRKEIGQAKFIYCDASRRKFLPWLRNSLTERMNRVIWKWNRSNLFLAATASTKRTLALLNFKNEVKRGEYDLVIGHNLGAFYPASVIAKKSGCQYACDIEDFHPGEHIEGDGKEERERRETIMKQILPTAGYVSAASSLIAVSSEKLCGLKHGAIIPVLNFFYSAEFRLPERKADRKIKLVWFSQFIGPGRGLEGILSKWDSLKENFELTLIGDSANGLDMIDQEGIELLPPLPQKELHAKLSQYDVGLALEMTNRDLNRDIALTNKILAYYQAGLFILATDTAAQKDFLVQHRDSGQLFLQDDEGSMLSALSLIHENRDQIRSSAIKRYEHAGNHGWEVESVKLEKVWRQILN